MSATAKFFLATALNLAEGALPAFLPVIPAGPQLKGIDGRQWLHDRVEDVLAALNAHPVDLPLDINHSTELKAPKGEESPAAAWLKAGRYRAINGVIEAAVEWTPLGTKAFENKEYKYVSPALIFNRTTGRVHGLSSVGLVPKPNLTDLPGLNAAFQNQEPSNMTLTPEQIKALCAAMGIAETSTPDAVIAQAVKLKTDLATANNASIDIAEFVPRSDYETVLNRATNAEGKIAEQSKTALNASANALIDNAVKDGKIAPASKEFYLGLCSDQAGLDKVKAFVEKAPKVIADASAAEGQPPNTDKALNATTLKIAAQFGNSVEDLKKNL